MEDLTFGEQVKIILGRKGMTIKELAEMIEERTGKKMSRQNMTQRLGRDNFQEQDMRMIAEILECPFHLSILSRETADMTAGESAVLAARGWKRTQRKRREKDTEEYEQEVLPFLQEQEQDVLLDEEDAEDIEDIIEERAGAVYAEGGQAAEADEIAGEMVEEAAQETVEYTAADEHMESAEAVHSGEEADVPAEDAQEVDMTIGELYEIHKELSELEENAEAGEPVEAIKAELEKPVQKVKEKKERFRTGGIFLRKKGNPVFTEEKEPVRQEEPVKQEARKIDLTPDPDDFEPVIKHDDVAEDRELGDVNPYTGREFQTNSVRMHPNRIGYVQVYDRATHKWTDMTEWAFLGYQERKKALLGKDYEPPIYLD